MNEYEKVRGRYETHVEWLEMYAARLKGVMAIKSAQGGVRLSQSSIKESKRMTLCKLSKSMQAIQKSRS